MQAFAGMPVAKFTIITPSFGQLEWLKLCVASVADQVAPQAQLDESKVEGQRLREFSQAQVSLPHGFAVEHIIQDGGTPGIEEFAARMSKYFKERYGGDFVQDLQTFELLHFRTASGYTLRVFKEPDTGMYDAINKGIAKMSGDVWAWLNSDEQYLPGTLTFVAGWFQAHAGTGILCGDALLTDVSGRALSYRKVVRPLWRHTRLVHLASLSCASFYRRSIVERAGVFDTTWRSIGDAEWMARMMKQGIRIEACGRLLSAFAFTGQNLSESPLAGKEASRWRTGEGAPPHWQTFPVIWLHRLRKLLQGAYRRRSFPYAIHTLGGEGRLTRHAEGLGWGWPASSAEDRHKEYATVLGTHLLATDYEELSGMLLQGSAAGQGPLAVDFANTQIVTMRRHDAVFSGLLECIDITVPDGMPLVWAMNRRGAGLKDRVYGPTFTRRFLGSCPAGKTHYLVGGSEECGRRFRERMLALNPTLDFVGGYHGLCDSKGMLEDDAAVLAEIREKRPDFIWVGLGTPKQYRWIARVKPKLDHGILLAVGFAFDVNAGMKPDAPLWMQQIGMTWLHRMASEPGRLSGRYLKYNTLFLWYSLLDMLSGPWNRIKLLIRRLGLGIVALFSSEIRDVLTGESLGRALVIPWGGRPRVIGHPGLPPLIPRFLPQKRLTYWKQAIGFTTHERPDYPRLPCVSAGEVTTGRVMNLVLTHLGGDGIRSVVNAWKGVCPEEDLWIAFGGSIRDFESIDYPRKVFVKDRALRREDNQRGKQSYWGIFEAMASTVEEKRPDFIYFCEYDHLPLIPDLNARQVAEMREQDADVMGHWLYRVDGTGQYHMLYHLTDPAFLPHWQSLSRREDPSVMLSMFGSGSMWSREAFLAVASRPQGIACYLELYLPTLAHHLGFRVRCWNESHHLISNLRSRSISVAKGRELGCWTVHPVKDSSR